MSDITYGTAAQGDIPCICGLIEDSRALLKADGIDQWQDGSPSADNIQQDINMGFGRVLRSGGEIIAYFALKTDIERDYARLWGGKWLPDGGKYATLHRVSIAGKYRGQGISRKLFSFATGECIARGIKHIRIDTHHDNARMRHIIRREGFTLFGAIRLTASGAQRLAYERALR